MTAVGRKAALKGRLASVGARGLRFAKIAVKEFAAPPDYFDDVAIDAYWTIVTDLAEPRELSRSDAPLIEMAARAYARYVTLDREIVATKSETSDKGFPSGKAQARAMALNDYYKAIGELGISPSSRIRSSGALQGTLLGLLGAAETKAATNSVYAARKLRVVQ